MSATGQWLAGQCRLEDSLVAGMAFDELETNPARIEIGVFDHLDDSGQALGRQYNDRLEIAAACDRSGFRGYHVAEHHGTPHGLAPAPNLLLSAIAQRTSTLRLGPMVMLLNLYHPLRAFEEICMLDQLSGGRLDLGIGRGATAFELGFFGVDAAVVQERYQEAADIVLKAMTVRRLDLPRAALRAGQRPDHPVAHAAAPSAALARDYESGDGCVGGGARRQHRGHRPGIQDQSDHGYLSIAPGGDGAVR
jgi:alkanesulfonate monooxygenase SsuD/methylene tetrahydromethanopterin reductase-like flavin-dependent oxidoreductase (luciferase family)